MNNTQFERIKSIMLLVLILTAVIQVGILWSYQNHGFPVNIFNAFLSSNTGPEDNEDEMAKTMCLQPLRIIVFDGTTRWQASSEADEYKSLYNEWTMLARKAFSLTELNDVSYNTWENLILKKCFIIEYMNPLPASLLRWAAGADESGNLEIQDVHKILITPYENAGINSVTLYILGSDKLYRADLPFNENGLDKRGYDEILEVFRESSILQHYEVYKETSYPFNFRPDILLVTDDASSSYLTFKNLMVSVPPKVSDLEEMTSVLLKNESESYDRTRDVSGKIVLKSLNSIYSVDNTGMLEYRTLEKNEDIPEKSMSNSFINAFQMLNSIKKDLIPETSMFLVGASEMENGCIFKFGYREGNMPVLFDNLDELPFGIAIEADSRRVTSFRWMIRDVIGGKNASFYNVHFKSLNEQFLAVYGKKITEIPVRNIVEGYKIEGITDTAVVSWIVETESGDFYPVMMKMKEGF